jgi:hypothetical protein
MVPRIKASLLHLVPVDLWKECVPIGAVCTVCIGCPRLRMSLLHLLPVEGMYSYVWYVQYVFKVAKVVSVPAAPGTCSRNLFL